MTNRKCNTNRTRSIKKERHWSSKKGHSMTE